MRTAETFSEEISKLVHDISFKRAEIINDFCKAYAAHLAVRIPAQDLFDKIELVEVQGTNEIRWYFREKK